MLTDTENKPDFLKDYHNLIVSANIISEEKLEIIHVTPTLDVALGGGIPEGSFVTLTGPAKCGKSTLALHIAANAQKIPLIIGKEKKDRRVYYLNVEGRLKPRDIKGVQNLQQDKCSIIKSQMGNILSADQFLSIAERIIHEDPGSVIIIDSYSALCTAGEMTADMDKLQRAEGAKLLAKFMRKVGNVVPINKNIVIGVNHLMSNPSGYGAATVEKGGYAVAYQTDVKLRAIKFSPLTIGTEQIGQETEWKIITSAIGGPGAKVSTFLRYGYGVDEILELVKMGVDLGLIKKGGAWLSYKEDKFQGQENARAYFLQNDKQKQLQKEIFEIIQC